MAAKRFAAGGAAMTFTEKLARLTEDRCKTRVSVRAGLPSTAISNYITKRSTPGADVALRLSRALNVSVEWLIDDAQDWPPVWVNAPEAPLSPVVTKKDRRHSKQVA
jgi:transcriptional regulator with XRE-family HTH domain